MPLVQGGPPQWIWERPAEQVKWELNRIQLADRIGFELRANCGLEIMRLQFFTDEEIDELKQLLTSGQ